MNTKVVDTDNNPNSGYLVGKIVRSPILSHTTYNEKFYEIMLQIKRLSDNTDILPVTISEKLMTDEKRFQEGCTLAVSGEYRSVNKMVNDKSKLVLYFFAKDILNDESEFLKKTDDKNYLKLIGFICKNPILRETPFHRHICDVLVAVNRQTNNKSDYIPCISWGRNARFMGSLAIGTKIELEGRIQSRPYYKIDQNGEQKENIAYEVSCKNFKVLENNVSSNNNGQNEENQENAL